jgi:hypothetical protein
MPEEDPESLTVLRKIPIPGISTSTLSPAFSTSVLPGVPV